MATDEQNYHVYVEIKRGMQKELLEKIFALFNEYKVCHKGWVSIIGTKEELIEELECEE